MGAKIGNLNKKTHLKLSYSGHYDKKEIDMV